MYTGPARMHWSLQQCWPCSFWDFLVHGFRHDFEKKTPSPRFYTNWFDVVKDLSSLQRCWQHKPTLNFCDNTSKGWLEDLFGIASVEGLRLTAYVCFVGEYNYDKILSSWYFHHSPFFGFHSQKSAYVLFASPTRLSKQLFLSMFFQHPGHAPEICLHQQHHSLLPLVAIGTGTEGCIKNNLIYEASFLWCTQKGQSLLPCSAWRFVKSFEQELLV